ncbi:hypothetical protein H310_11910 [Aphanomyces invadans]|uniref:Uncharacterized protein n=1 Tax=Aphanomyces invadans TaxID=157072 RepID=A0A024TKU0_9STRA|nr:hypothetical protein H310_11910 [Aphanomyces invadans]ETV94231.1 hypothetical protein H310_11910 [Aphanomyces invadans]|eukprot:XP_008876993.1 hypothetical protein H310_11910 [Aphanomyces invadans]
MANDPLLVGLMFLEEPLLSVPVVHVDVGPMWVLHGHGTTQTTSQSRMLGISAQTGACYDQSVQHKHSASVDAWPRSFFLKLLRTAPLEPSELYTFWYHRHGVMPTVMRCMRHLTTQWRALFPGLFAVRWSASILHSFPAMYRALSTRSRARFVRTRPSEPRRRHSWRHGRTHPSPRALGKTKFVCLLGARGSYPWPRAWCSCDAHPALQGSWTLCNGRCAKT